MNVLGRLRLLVLLVLVLLVAAACGPSAVAAPSGPAASLRATPADPAQPSGTITLYTSVQQPVVDATLTALATAWPGLTVEVFRAPTGELSARMAAEVRDGGVRADVLWLSDPLSMQGWASQGILQAWSPVGSDRLDPADRTDSFWGTRILNVVIVNGADLDPGPADWDDLTDPDIVDGVALPNPGFAGSAFGALGYFALHPDYGIGYYERLKTNGAVQVNSPDEVVTGVADGRFRAGITLDSSARAAVAKGSPIELVWPTSGAIALYSPVGVVTGSMNPAAARAFVEFILSAGGQAVLGAAGQEPVLMGSGGPEPLGAQVRPDWGAVFAGQDELLERYRAVFGG